MSKQKDYYSILQVNHDASQEAIERSYERLSRLYDPATSRRAKAAQRYQEITQAYEALSDHERRAQYDRELRRGGGPGAQNNVLSTANILTAGGGLVASVIIVLVIILVAGSGGSSETAAVTPTPEGQTPGPTGPAEPPDVEGEIVTTESGLQYIVLEEGDGASPTAADSVSVHYTGWLESDGSKFDSSVDRGAPAEFPLGGVIAGWTEGLQLMQEGAKYRFIIPSDLAYGEAGREPGIPGNATLIFDVELVEVIGAGGPDATPESGDEAEAEDDEMGEASD